MNAEIVPPDAIPGIWHEVRADVLRALEYTSNWNERGILERLIAYPPGMHLWRCDRAICITHFSDYPTQRICGLLLVAGFDRKSWLHNLEKIKTWAREMKCSEVVGYARDGWLPEMTKVGFEPDYRYIRMKL